MSRRSRDERGMAQSCQVPRGVPPQSAYADSSPASGGAFWCTLQAYRLASLSREVGFALAKAGGVEKESRFAWYRQPLSQTFGLPAPRPGSLLVQHSFIYEHGDAQRPYIFIISHAHPPSGGFHMAEPYFTLRRQYFTALWRNFTAGVSPLISFPLQPRWLRRGSR